MALVRLLASASGTLAIYGLYRLFKFIQGQLNSPLRYLPGPKNSNLFFGNLKQIWQAENSELHEQWVEEYGSTVKYYGLFSMHRLYTADTKAMNHIIMNSEDYQKPEIVKYNLSQIMPGEGLLVVEGSTHKKQRKIMNPAFGSSQIRELTEVFVEKAIQLRDIWASESALRNGVARIDVLAWLSRATLDVIGLAGFNYKFDALNIEGKLNELNEAFATMFQTSTRMSILPILQAWFPVLRVLPHNRAAEIKHAQKTMSRIGNQLLKDSKDAITSSDEKPTTRARDLLSLLVRANVTEDLPESQRLADKDVLAQIPTFLVAGHETTSSGTTWALFALTQNLDVQTKLRNELLTVTTDNPTMEELNSLTYLDYVVRETMRVHAPVPSTVRVAMKDDVVPLNAPFVDKKGQMHYEIRIRKGQTIFIPILAINRSKALWGDDAKEFRPERWESIPEATNGIPGVWANLLTFLGGPRACIGYKFSLIEMKALLFTLVRAFEFELAVPAKDIGKKSGIVQRPVLLTEPKANNQLPLLIKPYKQS